MGWESINLNDVEVTTKDFSTPVPEGTYTLRLIGAKPSPFREGQVDFDFMIDGETEYRGRRLFPTLPAPLSAQDWSVQAAALLKNSLGTGDAAEGEGPIEYFTRVAENGATKVAGYVTIENYKKRDGSAASKNNLRWFSLEPAV